MKQLIPGGLLIAVEGIDGAGKTSVATILAQYCGERGIACVLSKEPTSLKWGRELRRSAQQGRLTLDQELDLFRKDRAMHVAGTIRPALDQRHVVIVDRYYWSTAAYQGARGADPDKIIADHESFAPRPDVVLVLDVPVAQGLERIRRRGDEPNDFEKAAPLEKARAIFLDLAAKHPDYSLVVDASASVREVCRRCLAKMQSLAAEKLGSGTPALAVFMGTAE
jgi:dTMP kinase